MDEAISIQKADTIVSKHFKLYMEHHKTIGVLLSGGIDSSVITSYVLQFYPQSHILSMGTKASKDLPFVQLFCQAVDRPFEWVSLTEPAIQHALPTVRTLLEEVEVTQSLMQLSLAVGYYLIFQRAHELGITAIVTGQGPDILFAGYHKYKSLSGTDLHLEIKKDLALLETDKKRDGAMARHFGITLLNPYLEQDFVDFSMTVSPELKVKNGVEKYFMRRWGSTRHIPDVIVNRPKKAFQYSTGLQNAVMKIV
jgi:asparagine synthase (glutamine-hydrolysing)